MNEVYLIIETSEPSNVFTVLDSKGKELNLNWISDVWNKMANCEVVTNGEDLKAIKYW